MKRTVDSLLFMILAACSALYARQLTMPEAATLQKLATGFVESFVNEDVAGAVKNFNSTMRAALHPSKLQATWEAINTQAGRFKRQVGIRTEKVQQFEVVFVTCEFEKTTLDMKIVFDNTGRIAGLFFVPSQASPKTGASAPSARDPLQEQEVVVGSGEWSVHGTLALPRGPGPFPAIVLVHGSGPHDRDESIGPNKPFRDLSEGLTARGMAVLRYEKRTKEHANRFVSLKDSLTVKEETIDDALLAVSLLRKTPRINPEKIFVLGHSLGGMLIPRIGTLDPHIAGLIIMAGTSRHLEDVILDQFAYIFSLDGTVSESEEAQIREIKSQVARVKDPTLSSATPSPDLPLGIPANYWLDLRGFNPPEVARGLKQPLLILQGERDYQVTMEDIAGWKKSLSSKQNVEFKTYQKLNHLFIEGEGKSTPHEYAVEGHVATAVIEDIAAWIRLVN